MAARVLEAPAWPCISPTLAGVVFPYNVLVLCMSAMYEMWGDEMARRKPKNLKLGAVGVYVVRGPREDRRWYWQASCSVAGKRKTIWSGWATKAEAERAACEARAALPTDLGTPDAQAKQEAEAGLTVAAVLERWMEDCYARPYISPRTLKAYRDAATNLTRLIGGYRLTEMSIVETQGYLNARHAEGLRVRTAWAELSIFRTAWRWGKAARLHDEPLHLPAPSSVKMEKVRAPRPTRDEAWATWDALREQGAPEWLVRTYLLGLVTGARTGELYEAKVGDFDLDEGTVQIGRDRERGVAATKTGARVVYLDPAAVATLRPYVEGRAADERFIGDRAQSTMSHTANYLRKAAIAAGAPAHPLYGLRRAATDAYYDAGAKPEEEAAALGHSIEVAQRHYRRIRSEQAREAARKVALGARPTPTTPAPTEGADVIPIERGRERSG